MRGGLEFPYKIRITESKSCYQKLNSGHRCASALNSPSSPRHLLLGRDGTRTTSSRRCWRFRLLPNEHRLDNSRSVSTHPPRHRLPILFQLPFEVLLDRGDVRLLLVQYSSLHTFLFEVCRRDGGLYCEERQFDQFRDE